MNNFSLLLYIVIIFVVFHNYELFINIIKNIGNELRTMIFCLVVFGTLVFIYKKIQCMYFFMTSFWNEIKDPL